MVYKVTSDNLEMELSVWCLLIEFKQRIFYHLTPEDHVKTVVTSLNGFPHGAVVKNPPVSAGDARDLGTRVGKISWSRKWQPTPVFLHGEFHGQRSLMGYRPTGSQLDVIELLSMQYTSCNPHGSTAPVLYIWKH